MLYTTYYILFIACHIVYIMRYLLCIIYFMLYSEAAGPGACCGNIS